MLSRKSEKDSSKPFHETTLAVWGDLQIAELAVWGDPFLSCGPPSIKIRERGREANRNHLHGQTYTQLAAAPTLCTTSEP